jgi:sialic acid synthase SpsE
MSLSFSTGQRPYIIAEIGANHNGDIALARKMIEIASDMGCDAVKFQSWDEGLFAKVVYQENKFLGDDYRERADHSLETIMNEYKVTRDEMAELAEHCKKVGVHFSSTPFSCEQVDDLVTFGARFVKIASMDLVSDYLLRHAARTGLPIVLSTGFGTMEDIDHAVRTIEGEGNRQIVLLHCLALYPPPDEDVNLANIDMLRTAFGYPVGFSDHTLGTEIALASFARGSMMLEKHFTLDKQMSGWDHKISSDVPEMAAICRGRDRIHAAIGVQRRTLSDAELGRATEFRRSIVAARDIKKGELIAAADIAYRRPGRGLKPNHDQLVIGRVAARDIAADDLLSWDDLNSATA